MRRVNNGRWILAMLVVASLVVPGVVAARQQSVAAPAPVSAAVADLVGEDLGPAAELLTETAASAGTCFNTPCTSTAQCRTRCDEPSAVCAPVTLPPHYKFCFLP